MQMERENLGMLCINLDLENGFSDFMFTEISTISERREIVPVGSILSPILASTLLCVLYPWKVFNTWPESNEKNQKLTGMYKRLIWHIMFLVLRLRLQRRCLHRETM